MDNEAILNTLVSAGYSVSLCGFSALDRYLGLPALPFTWIETNADITILARLFDDLRFPGIAIADAALDAEGQTWYFRCFDPEDRYQPSYQVLSFSQDWKTQRFHDPAGIYPQLQAFWKNLHKHTVNSGYDTPVESWWKGLNPHTDYYRAAMDSALIVARYGDHASLPSINLSFHGLSKSARLGEEAQRVLLTCLLVSSRPDLGLELLKTCDFVVELWAELSLLDNVDHSKEFHPEGNVWKHTMETFRYRKTCDIRLSLGLLLHDIGKPLSKSFRAHPFEKHAELGAGQARRFLKRLGFDETLINDVCYLVKNHMLPAAIPRLPLTRTQEVLQSPLFPTMLELYRCDEASSFKGLEGYYESSAVYQNYLKHRRNPYRSADGKKLT
jgi:poly(A) polymerase